MILDVNLPRLDGFEVCRRLRADSRTPIMMLTVRGDEEDLVRGARSRRRRLPDQALQPAHAARPRAGPAAPRRDREERRGRVRARLRSTSSATRSRRRRQRGAPDQARVPPAPAAARERRPGDRDRAPARSTSGASAAAGDRQLLKQLVHRLRQKIEADPAAPRYLLTVPGVGYELDAEGRDQPPG